MVPAGACAAFAGSGEALFHLPPRPLVSSEEMAETTTLPRPPGGLSPLTISASPDWASATTGGLMIQGPSRRAIMRHAAPSTPPMLRVTNTPTPVTSSRVLPRPSPLGGDSKEETSVPPRIYAPQIPDHAGDIVTDLHVDAANDSAWAVATMGGLQITGPSRRWMMRHSAPSTPVMIRPGSSAHSSDTSGAHPGSSTPQGRMARPPSASVPTAVQMSGAAHSRLRASLERLHAMAHAGSGSVEPLNLPGQSPTADELVMQLDMLVDQLEARQRP